MICYITRGSLASDVRMQKYIRACKATNTPYFVISWDRLLENNDAENEYAFKHYAAYGDGKSFLLNFLFLIYVYWHLIIKWRKYRVIHAANFESYALIFPFKYLGKKLIYDMYDRGRWHRFEEWLCTHSDLFILPSRYRLEQIELNESDFKRFLEVENVPIFDYNQVKEKKISTLQIKLAYVGTFEQKKRGIENTISVVENNPKLSLCIAGSGGGLEEFVKESASRCNRIKYFGKVDYQQALQIMGDADFIMGLYYIERSPAHKYAAPNKYYESLFLHTPLITNEGTIMSKLVKEFNTGYLVDEAYDGLNKFFEGMHLQDIETDYNDKVRSCAQVWQEKFHDYLNTKIIGEYLEIVKSL